MKHYTPDMYKPIYPYDPQFVAEMMAMEQEIGCITVGSKLSWPKPLPRRTAASAKAKAAARPAARKKSPAPAA